MSKIKIFSLGGLNESGKNMYVVDVDNDLFIFDAGLKYADDKMLGVDYIIPDLKFLKDNLKRIKGIFITHAHEKYMGAVSDIVKNIPSIKVYATKFTVDILKKEFEDNNIKYNNLHLISAHKNIKFGKNSIFPVSLTHSVPDTVGYVLNTSDGAICYTGNFVFDSSMTGSYKTDIGKLAYVGKQGVLCLLSESIYAEREGHTSPNNRAASFIRDVLSKSEDRIIATVFPAHFYRIQELLNEVSKTHRKVVIMGKRLQETINYARENGYINFDKRIVGDLTNLNDKNTVVLISDAKESPFANLQRIIKGFDKYIKIKETDTVFITEPTYDGIEKVTAEIMDEVAMLGADAINLSSKKHLLHHASREDLMLMINLMNPKYYFPVKGEYRYQLANAKVAEEIGVPKENIILKQNGDVCEFIDGKLNLKCFDKVKVDEILVDGNNGEDVGNLVLKDREMLGENGIVIVSCTLDRSTKKIVGGPEILTRGFIYVKDNQELLEQTRELCVLIINDNILENTKRVDYSKIKNEVRERLGHFFYEKTESKPMIITVIQEV